MQIEDAMCSEVVETVSTSPSYWLQSPEAWSAVAGFAGAIAAISAAFVTGLIWRTWWLDKRQRMLNEYRDDYEDRRDFWAALRHTFGQYKGDIGLSNESSTNFDAWLESSPSPPDVKNIPQNFHSWLNKHQNDISSKEVFKFTKLLYERKEEDAWATMIYDLRSKLTKFWDSWSEIFWKRSLIKRFDGKQNELKILCWLEVALGKTISSKAQVKRGFYDLAEAMRKKTAKSLSQH